MEIFKMDSELNRRLASGIIIVASIIGGLLVGGSLWLVVTAATSIISLWEYYQLLETRGHLSKGIGILASIILFSSIARGTFYLYLGPVIVLFAFTILLAEIVRRHLTGDSNALWNMGATLSGLVYITLPWIFLYHLRTFPMGLYFLLALFLCTWSCDVSAYIIGSKWGERFLSEEISPNKTWEGFAGGFCGSLLGGAIIAFTLSMPVLPFITIGLICGVAGQLGDLGESLLKRELGVKDSGDTLPGHGGFLDRFDSILINATLTYLVFGVIIG